MWDVNSNQNNHVYSYYKIPIICSQMVKQVEMERKNNIEMQTSNTADKDIKAAVGREM